MSDVIYWCEEHATKGSNEDFCMFQWDPLAEDNGRPCRIVERRIVPSDAVVVCRGPDGEWPDWAVEAMSGAWIGSKHDRVGGQMSDALDALAEASRKETG